MKDPQQITQVSSAATRNLKPGQHKTHSVVRCDKCKHWMRDTQKIGGNFKISQCSKAKMFWDSTEWGKEDDDRFLKEEAKENKMFVQDASDYRAVLYTAPDFFCYHFDEIES